MPGMLAVLFGIALHCVSEVERKRGKGTDVHGSSFSADRIPFAIEPQIRSCRSIAASSFCQQI